MKLTIKFIFATSIFITINTALFSQTGFYWAESSTDKIFKSDLDGSSNKKELIAGQHYTALSADTINNLLYIVDEGKKEILVYDIIAKNVKTIKQKLVGPKDVHYNYKEKMLYYIDGNDIFKMNLDGSNVTTIVTNLDQPSSIVIDDTNDKLFFSELEKGIISITDLNGNSPKVLIQDQSYPTKLFLDLEGNIYWKNYCGASSCSGLLKAKIDGSKIKYILSGFYGSFFVDQTRNKIYFTKSSYLNRICTVDLNGKSEKIYFDGANGSVDLLFINSLNLMYCTNSIYGISLISCKEKDFSQTNLLQADMYNPSFMIFDTIDNKVYWINAVSFSSDDRNSSIMRANLDGSNIEKLPIDNSIFGYNHIGLSINYKEKKLYWIEKSKNIFLSSNLDGSNVEKLPISNTFKYPTQLIFDDINNNLIWSDWGQKAIYKSDLLGNNVVKIVDESISFQPLQIAMDNINKKLFWIDGDKKSLFVSELDGSNAKSIAAISSDGVNSLYHSPSDGYLYWSAYFNNKINRCKVDGSNLELFIQVETLINYARITSMALINDKTLSTNFINSKNEKITISPNPVINDFSILTDKSTTGKVNIYNSVGQNVKSFSVNHPRQKFNVEQLNSGIYSGEIIWSDNTRSVFKFMKL